MDNSWETIRSHILQRYIMLTVVEDSLLRRILRLRCILRQAQSGPHQFVDLLIQTLKFLLPTLVTQSYGLIEFLHDPNLLDWHLGHNGPRQPTEKLVH